MGKFLMKSVLKTTKKWENGRMKYQRLCWSVSTTEGEIPKISSEEKCVVPLKALYSLFSICPLSETKQNSSSFCVYNKSEVVRIES